MKSPKTIIALCLILAAVLLSFFPALKNNFIDWDDTAYVVGNNAVHAISAANLKIISTGFFAVHYHPLTMFSYMLEYHFFGLNPFGYHLDNLILHLFNCLLVFWFIYRLSSSTGCALLVTLLFGVHPIQVESVAWISERKNLLYAFFYLGALISYLYYLKQNRAKFYYFCLGLFLFSLLSKSMAVTLPLVLLLLDYAASRKARPRVLIEKIPFLVLAVIFGGVALYAASDPHVYLLESGAGLFTKLTVICADSLAYLYKIFLISVPHPYGGDIKADPYYYPCCCIAVFALLALVTLSRPFGKKVILGSGLFLLMIFPAIRFLPSAAMMVADRYAYLACLGIFYLLAQGCLWLFRRRSSLARAVLILILAAALIFLGQASWQRSKIWKNDLSLWNYFTRTYPGVSLGYLGRGLAFLRNGDYPAARLDLERAVRMGNPSGGSAEKNLPHFNSLSLYATINLATAYNALGRKEEAINALKEVINFNPELEMPYANLALLYSAMGNFDQAVKVYKKALEVFPDSAQMHSDFGALLASAKKYSEAIAEFKQSIQIDPGQISAYLRLATVYHALNRQNELKELYKKAVEQDLPFFSAYYYLANLCSGSAKDKEAVPLYQKALQINPNSKEACLGLGTAYLTLGKNEAAVHWLEQSLRLDPQFAPAHHNLALAYYYAKQYALAARHYEQAIKLGYPVNPKLEELLKPFQVARP